MDRLRTGWKEPRRWLAAVGLGLLGSSPTLAQPQPAISVFETPAAKAAPNCDRPSELPPLLPVPPGPMPPRPSRLGGPVGEYDHGQFYLPERAPDPRPGPDRCGPAGRFWLAATIELG